MFVALLGNDIFQYTVVITLLVLIAVWRFIGLKKTGRWLVGMNKPEARAEKAKAKATAE